MSRTPITDAAEWSAMDSDGEYTGMIVSAEIARKLETDLAETRADLVTMCKSYSDAQDNVSALIAALERMCAPGSEAELASALRHGRNVLRATLARMVQS